MAGCFVWSLCQALAIGYGRGQELTEVASRYTELFSLGLIGNAWFVIRAVEILSNRWFQILLPTFFGIFLYGHITHYSSDMHDIRRNYRLSLIQTANVSMYLKTKNKTYLQQPKWQIPYPDPVPFAAAPGQPHPSGNSVAIDCAETKKRRQNELTPLFQLILTDYCSSTQATPLLVNCSKTPFTVVRFSLASASSFA
jgi:hypothetical protein